MARLTNPETGTVVEVSDGQAARYEARGWVPVDSARPSAPDRRPRKSK